VKIVLAGAVAAVALGLPGGAGAGADAFPPTVHVFIDARSGRWLFTYVGRS
jgi:hypothetical protein